MEDRMLSCNETTPYLVRLTDDRETIDAALRARLDSHLESCASCRTALETQRAVSAVLRMRPADRVSPEFSHRLAARLDEATGWFGIADWRAWTLRLAPVAAALALAIALGASAPAQPPLTVEDLSLGSTEASSPDALLWRSDVSADALVETMLTGDLPALTGGSGNVR
jgi:hypothetical protein